jgi:hypothetical protein
MRDFQGSDRLTVDGLLGSSRALISLFWTDAGLTASEPAIVEK